MARILFLDPIPQEAAVVARLAGETATVRQGLAEAVAVAEAQME